MAFSERALWLYKRGTARVLLGRLDAGADLTAALDAKPAGWVNGRIHLELGKLADLRTDRPAALQEYKLAGSTCRDNGDELCQSEADRLTRKPFALQLGSQSPVPVIRFVSPGPDAGLAGRDEWQR